MVLSAAALGLVHAALGLCAAALFVAPAEHVILAGLLTMPEALWNPYP